MKLEPWFSTNRKLQLVLACDSEIIILNMKLVTRQTVAAAVTVTPCSCLLANLYVAARTVYARHRFTDVCNIAYEPVLCVKSSMLTSDVENGTTNLSR